MCKVQHIHSGLASFSAMCKRSCKPGIQMAESKSESLKDSRGWEMVTLEEALSSLGQTPDCPSVGNLISILQKCRKEKNLAYAKLVHLHIRNNGLETHRTIGNHLVPMLVDCGSVSEAQQVFNRMIYRSEHSWTSLIYWYVECGQSQDALNLYKKMQEDSVQPSTHTLVALLKLCAGLKCGKQGRQIYIDIARQGYERDVFVGSTLVDMYKKCSLLAEAQDIFDRLPAQNVVSWTALIAGYVEHRLGQEAVKCFEWMQLEEVPPNSVTLACYMKACGSMGAIDKGRELHIQITKSICERQLLLSNTLINMYVRSGSLIDAKEVFNQLVVRDVVSWTTLIAGYNDHGFGQEAMNCFEQMRIEGISPNHVTFICSLEACGSIGALEKGQELHVEIACSGFERDLSICNTLMDMYANCGSLLRAQEVFDKLPVRDTISWNVLIAGYAQHGFGQEALKFFEQMQLEGLAPGIAACICCLKSCQSIEFIDKGREIHILISQKGFGEEAFVGSTLVDLYAKCGSIVEAQEVFSKMPVQDGVLWNSLIAGYVDQDHAQEALKFFEQMHLEGEFPDDVTFSCSLKACGNLGAIHKGREIHTETLRTGFEKNSTVANTLVIMYAKCGSISEAEEVFNKLAAPEVASWSAMIKGYGLNHEGSLAIQCFENMKRQGVKPDSITFTCLLTACSRTRMVLKGQEYFQVMREECGIAPTMDQYASMAYLLAQSQYLYETEKFLETMPCFPCRGTWVSLLSACKIFGEAELGMRCFQQLVHSNPGCAAPYLLMANTYASIGRWDDADRVEDIRKNAGSKKKLASAYIEVNKMLHEFRVGKSQNKELEAILETLILQVRVEGHVPYLDLVL